MFFKVIQLIFSINDKLELNSLAQTACNLIKKLQDQLVNLLTKAKLEMEITILPFGFFFNCILFAAERNALCISLTVPKKLP